MSLYHELKRRNVFRVGIAYLALAWLLTEVSGTLFPAFGVPDWGVRFVVIVFALGFVPALIISWVYELTSEGLKREKEVVRDASITHLTAKRLDMFTIGLIVVALAFIMTDRLWLSPRFAQPIAAPAESVTDKVQPSGPESTDPQYPPNSIAVLPFVNMSDDTGNEYFSDGISEELLNLLAKIPELRVIARTSSFAYKGKDVKIPDIARELNVGHVLEGSVRKSGSQVRITAQLIRASDSSHTWSQTYDRTLNDIFAIQDEIAAIVVAQLKVTLLGAAPKLQETNPAAYALFLQARHLGYQGTPEAWEQSVALYQQALVIDPDYVAAWDGLAMIYTIQGGFGLPTFGEGYRLAREAANNALEIDPDDALAHSHLGKIAMVVDYDFAASARHHERALALAPNNTDIIQDAATLIENLGRLDEAITLFEYQIARDPVNSRGHHYLGLAYLNAGRLEEAIASFSTALALSPGAIWTQFLIGEALLLKGEPEAALAAMQQESGEAYRLIGLSMAYHALGQSAESDSALAELIEKYEQEAANNISYVLAFRGEADRAFEWLEKAVQFKDTGLPYIGSNILFANIHSDPRWLPFLESIGKSPEQLAAIEFTVTLPE